jgi:hypothetical protein
MPALLVIKKLDSPVPAAPGRWLRGEVVAVFETTTPRGSGEEVAAGSFVHFEVTDKTVAEMQQYLDTYNRLIDMTVVSGPDPQGFRRINVRNNNTNVSGTVGGWTTTETDNIITEWNARYPTYNLVTVQFLTGTNPGDTWQCEGTFTQGQADEFEEVIIEKGLQQMDKRKIWYITESGMTNIEAAGGSQSGTASNLGGILRDARLD